MPEGDTIFRAARTLNAALTGKLVTRFESVLPYLMRVDVDTPLRGRTIVKVESHGKWLVMHFSGDLILLTHLLMSGSWHIYRPGEKWKRRRDDMRIVVGTADFEAVAFRVPIAEFHTGASLARREGFNKLGTDVLAEEFDEEKAAEQLRS
ncbi:MAG TPA: DNA-formamidopyrimidine glycosylase family protein, partial [Terriglobales bacterium]|nr:DNA-formamidopyrimidine glycosylase family protein [Terriglobales bacterium]